MTAAQEEAKRTTAGEDGAPAMKGEERRRKGTGRGMEEADDDHDHAHVLAPVAVVPGPPIDDQG